MIMTNRKLTRSFDSVKKFMEEVLIDDNMVFDIDNLKGFLNDTSSFGFIAKENNKIIGFAYCFPAFLSIPPGRLPRQELFSYYSTNLVKSQFILVSCR